MRLADGYRRENENVRFTMAEEDMEVPPGEKTGWYGPSSVTFDEDTYDEGTYVIQALLTNPKTGNTIRERRKMIYLNKKLLLFVVEELLQLFRIAYANFAIRFCFMDFHSGVNESYFCILNPLRHSGVNSVWRRRTWGTRIDISGF